MRYQSLILLGLMAFSTAAMADLTSTEQRTVDALNCRATGYQFLSSQRVLLGDSYGSQQQLFLIKNIARRPLVVDYPEGHIGASAGITQVLAKGGWATYYYKPGTTMPTQDADGDTAQRKPRWSCALQSKDGPAQAVDCRQALYVCEIDISDAASLNPDVKAILQQNQTGWLTVGKTSDSPNSQSSISKALKASIIANNPAPAPQATAAPQPAAQQASAAQPTNTQSAASSAGS